MTELLTDDVPTGTENNVTLTSEVEGAPCLIVLPSYKIAFYDCWSDSHYSVDMVRFKLKTSVDNVAAVNDVCSLWAVKSEYYHYTSTGTGKYRDMHVHKFGETSVVVGMSLISAKGNCANEGFLEFNPNKAYDEGAELMQRLIGVGCRFIPTRFDMAIDFPIDRNTVRIVKDKRDYRSEISNSLTEYLGARNAPGRVKVYDKQVQAKLDAPCTRVELTCDASWNVSRILEKLPLVFSYDTASLEGLQGITKAFAVSVRAHMAKGDTLENWLVLCEPRMRANIRNAFKSNQVLKYSASCISKVMQEVESIAKGETLTVL